MQAVQSFQLRILREEINSDETGRNVWREKLETFRSKLRENMRPKLMQSVVSSIRQKMRNLSAVIEKIKGALAKLSERQCGTLWNGSHNSIVIGSGGDLPLLLIVFLLLAP